MNNKAPPSPQAFTAGQVKVLKELAAWQVWPGWLRAIVTVIDPIVTSIVAGTIFAVGIVAVCVLSGNPIPDVPGAAHAIEEAKIFVGLSLPHPTPVNVNAQAWMTIRQAAAEEKVCEPELVYAIWSTETGRLDCEDFRDIPGETVCRSDAGAQGPLQFMPGTWPTYSEVGWDTWSLHDSARAACRMTAALQLPEQSTRQAFAIRFTGADGGSAWNRHEGQAFQVWDTWKSFSFVWLHMPSDDLSITQAFGAPYPNTPRLRELGLVGMLHSNGVDLGRRGEAFSVGSPVDGVVIEVLKTPSFGTIVKIQIDGAPNAVVELWHLSETVEVNVGDHVTVGDPIGTATGAGSSSDGKHLHLRLTIEGADVDPMQFMEDGP